jgi:hypothetical protein
MNTNSSTAIYNSKLVQYFGAVKHGKACAGVCRFDGAFVTDSPLPIALVKSETRRSQRSRYNHPARRVGSRLWNLQQQLSSSLALRCGQSAIRKAGEPVGMSAGL